MTSPDQSPERLEIGGTPLSRRLPRWGIVLLAPVAVIALTVGGLGGFLLARQGVAAPTDVAGAACQMVAPLQQSDPEDWNLESPEMWRAMAVGPMLHAAAIENPDHRRLGTAGDELLRAVQQLDAEAMSDRIDEIRRLCADI